MAKFDSKKLTPLDWAVVVCGGLTFIALFLPWWQVSYGPYSASASGWNTSWGWIGALLIIAAAVGLVLVRSDVKVAIGTLQPTVAMLGLAAIGALIVIIRIATVPSGNFGDGFSYGPAVGIYLALIAGIVESVIFFMGMRKSATPVEAPNT